MADVTFNRICLSFYRFYCVYALYWRRLIQVTLFARCFFIVVSGSSMIYGFDRRYFLI